MPTLLTQKNRATRKQRCEQELRAIQHTHDGILHPKDVVKFARDHKESALHSQFTWNVGKAAEQYWLEQARRVIRVHVTVHEGVADAIRIFVSMDDDKVNDGGYRLISDVMSESERRAQLLHQALKELKTWQEKYQCLAELAKIFEAVDDVDDVDDVEAA